MALYKEVWHAGTRQELSYHAITKILYEPKKLYLEIVIGSWKDQSDRTSNPTKPLDYNRFEFKGDMVAGIVTDMEAEVGVATYVYQLMKYTPEFINAEDI